MTFQQVKTMISAVGVPFAYHHFEEGSGQQPPFITFYYDGENDLKADNINYQTIRPLTIELYTDNKNFALEAAVESVLTANDLAFSRSEIFIDSEQMYMVTYNTEVLINA
jgi:hypothetical protein